MHAQILRKCKAKTGGSRVGCKSSYILTLSPTVVVLRLLIKSISKSCRRDILSLTTSPKMKCHLYYRTINIPKEMIQNLWHLEVCHWPPNSFFSSSVYILRRILYRDLALPYFILSFQCWFNPGCCAQYYCIFYTRTIRFRWNILDEYTL